MDIIYYISGQKKKYKNFQLENSSADASSFNVAKTHILATLSNNRESYRNQWYYQLWQSLRFRDIERARIAARKFSS